MGKYFNQVTIYGLPWRSSSGKLVQFIYQHEVLLENLLLSFSPVRSIVQSITKRLFPRYHLIRLDQINFLDVERSLTSENKPFFLEDDGVNPMYVIATSRK
jgi:hypothetical protein